LRSRQSGIGVRDQGRAKVSPVGIVQPEALFDRPTLLKLLVGQFRVSLRETRDRVELSRSVNVAESEYFHCFVEQRRLILHPNRAQRRADNVQVFAGPVLPSAKEPLHLQVGLEITQDHDLAKPGGHILTRFGVFPVVHAPGQLIDNPGPCPTLGVLDNLAGDLHLQIVPAPQTDR
jgi:hypothetical protein